MATGGDERKGDAVSVPPSRFIGMELELRFFFHGFFNAVALAVLAIFLLVLGKADLVALLWKPTVSMVGVQVLTAVLALHFTGSCCGPLLSLFAFLVDIVTTSLLHMYCYYSLSWIYSYFGGDTVKSAVAVAVVIVAQLALFFWGAKAYARRLINIIVPTELANGHSQSQPGSTSLHPAPPLKPDGNAARA